MIHIYVIQSFISMCMCNNECWTQYNLCFHRMAENQRDTKPLFRDQREIEVAVDYMKGSGKFVLCVCISTSTLRK